MTEEEIKAELDKCIREPWYYYNTYWLINGEKPKHITEEEWKSHNCKYYGAKRTCRIDWYHQIKKQNENKT